MGELVRLLETLERSGFWGVAEVHFRAGHVAFVRKLETVMLQKGDGKNPQQTDDKVTRSSVDYAEVR